MAALAESLPKCELFHLNKKHISDIINQNIDLAKSFSKSDLIDKNKKLISDLNKQNANLLVEMSLENSSDTHIDQIKSVIAEKKKILIFPKNSSFISLLTDDYELIDKKYIVSVEFEYYHNHKECNTNWGPGGFGIYLKDDHGKAMGDPIIDVYHVRYVCMSGAMHCLVLDYWKLTHLV